MEVRCLLVPVLTLARGDVAALGPQLRQHSGSMNIPATIPEVELPEAAQLSKAFGGGYLAVR